MKLWGKKVMPEKQKCREHVWPWSPGDWLSCVLSLRIMTEAAIVFLSLKMEGGHTPNGVLG